MNVNPLIEHALKRIIHEKEEVPISPIIRQRDANAYITYYTYLERPADYADDEPQCEETSATVDIWCRGDFKPLLAAVKKRLRTAGFTIRGVGPEQYESSTKIYHVPIDVYIEGTDEGGNE